MALFSVTISRTYSIVEGFTRYIEADTKAEAEYIANALADESDGSCPDDCTEIEGGEGASEFYPEAVLEAVSVPHGFETVTLEDIQ